MRSVTWARVSGPLALFADGFRSELDRLGYTPQSREVKVNEMAGLSRWLDGECLGVEDLDARCVEAFLVVFGSGRRQQRTAIAMVPLMNWLAERGVVARIESLPVHSALEDLIDRYRGWMVNDRALAVRTIERYEETARRFLVRAGAGVESNGLDGVSSTEVTAFLLAESARGLAVGSVKGRVAELRSLLRFLYVEGLTARALADAVPPVAGWKDTSVPVGVSAADVQSLLDSCDRSTVAGKRDLAMLCLLARLGLRAAEVAELELSDIDWRLGQVMIRGKGRRHDPMPLPVEVGDALAIYVAEARPCVATRIVFVTVAAPWRPMWSTAVSQIVWRQSIRAGLKPTRAHRLRHALASDLLDNGVTLPEISQVLRHRDLATTAVYAKVDHGSLRGLARPWPMVTK